MKKIVLVAAFTLANGSLSCLGAPPQQVTIMQGAIMCPNHGDLVVFSTSGSMMPGCQRLARDSVAIFVSSENGIVQVHSTASSTTWWVLQASLRSR